MYGKLEMVALVALAALVSLQLGAGPADGALPRFIRSSGHEHNSHHSMVHNHLSRKVFDRACAASKDTIDEIIACFSTNEGLLKAIKKDTAQDCFKDAFNMEFDPKDVIKHKELICNNREKFENMTTCIYKRTGEMTDAKEMEKLTEIMVDVGLCIINALDG